MGLVVWVYTDTLPLGDGVTVFAVKLHAVHPFRRSGVSTSLRGLLLKLAQQISTDESLIISDAGRRWFVVGRAAGPGPLFTAKQT